MKNSYFKTIRTKTLERIPSDPKYAIDRKNIVFLIELAQLEKWDKIIFIETIEANMDILLEKVKKDKRKELRVLKKTQQEIVKNQLIDLSQFMETVK